jgi:hypothetical protein
MAKQDNPAHRPSSQLLTREIAKGGSMPVVEEYWAGVVQRLQAEVDVFARLVRHNATQGQENEAALARLLRAFIPQRFGVGSGMVIDRHDQYSRQTDIVLFEQTDEPTILAQTTQLLHPIESVRACIEVKTRLRLNDIKSCRTQRSTLHRLKSATSNPDGSKHPLYVLLAYDAQPSPQTIHSKFSAAPEEEMPDLYCVLEPGIVGGRAGVLRGAPSQFASGLALLREKENGGRRIGAPEPVADTELGDTVAVDGRMFPVVDIEKKRYLGEPPRALLLFVEALARALAQQQRRPEPVLTHYLDDSVSDLHWMGS